MTFLGRENFSGPKETEETVRAAKDFAREQAAIKKRERYKFVHCPAPNCDRKLNGSWKDFLTGELHPKTGRPVYQCPHCKLKFTADDFTANAIPVPDDDTDVVLFDAASGKLLDAIHHRMKFTDGEATYVHLPVSVCLKENIRCLCFEVGNMTQEEIEKECKRYIERTARR